MEKLTPEDVAKLQVGQKLTEVTREGRVRYWEVLARDPKLNPSSDLHWKYIYVLDSFGRIETQRWYYTDLEHRDVYLNYPEELILEKRIEKAQSYLKSLLDLREKSKQCSIERGS